MIRIGFLRSCFGCCSLRTGVLLCAIIDLIFGIYDIIEFCLRVVLELHHGKIRYVQYHSYNAHQYQSNTTSVNNNNATLSNSTLILISHGELYGDSAFAQIVFGCVDLLIAALLLYVVVNRRYELRVVVFVASIWSFVFGFLDLVSFAIFVVQEMWVEVLVFLVEGLLELLFGYIILSYFKFITQVMGRGLAEVNLSHVAPEGVGEDVLVVADGALVVAPNSVAVGSPALEVVVDPYSAVVEDDRPIMDDEEDEFIYDDRQSLVS